MATMLDCGHVALVSPDEIEAIGLDPATNQTVCNACARSLPPQPMTIYFLGDDTEGPYTKQVLDTDRIPFPPGSRVRSLCFLAKDGQPTSVSWRMLNGVVKYIHVSADVFGLWRWGDSLN